MARELFALECLPRWAQEGVGLLVVMELSAVEQCAVSLVVHGAIGGHVRHNPLGFAGFGNAVLATHDDTTSFLKRRVQGQAKVGPLDNQKFEILWPMAESKYKQALVTHIDILGFREMVNESEREPSRIADLRHVLKVLKRQIGTGVRYSSRIPDQDRPPTPLFRAFNFSDLTVRATIIDPENDFLNIFMGELFTLVNEQCRLACRDDGNSPILLRGGVTSGPIDVHPGLPEEDFLFGPAVVRAYDLENTAAIFPRIVVDPKVIRRAASVDSTDVQSQLLKRTGTFYKQLVSLSEDGVYFVDYLNACEDYSYSNFFVFGGGGMSFAIHKHMIETQLKRLKEERAPERTIQKYLWLANYHNSKVPRLPDPEFIPPVFAGEPDEAETEHRNKQNREGLLISEELLKLLK